MRIISCIAHYISAWENPVGTQNVNFLNCFDLGVQMLVYINVSCINYISNMHLIITIYGVRQHEGFLRLVNTGAHKK